MGGTVNKPEELFFLLIRECILIREHQLRGGLDSAEGVFTF